MSAGNVKEVFQSWLSAVNGRSWDHALTLLSPNISYNGDDISGEEYLQLIRDDLEATPDEERESETLVLDDSGSKLAARLIHRGSLVKAHHGPEVTGKPIEWTEHVFAWSTEGKITKLISLSDTDAFRSTTSPAPTTPPIPQSKPSNPTNMAQAYRDYIGWINALTMKDNFPKYCHPHVTHNMQRYSIDEYRRLIESSIEDIQGLHFAVEELVVDEASQQVAARLGFTGRPVKAFAGIEPNGGEVRFSEHAYYRLHEGKIAWVWSLLDLEAYRRRMAN